MDGLEALRSFKQQTNIPIVFVTARRRELDEIVGLELGADDYITKPFDMDILLARVKAVLRRYNDPIPSITAIPLEQSLQVGDIFIDPLAHIVRLKDQVIELSPKEFDLLLVLAQEADRVISTESLLSRVWGADWVGETQTVYVHIRWLREKIEKNPAHPQRLITVKGVGYKLSSVYA